MYNNIMIIQMHIKYIFYKVHLFVMFRLGSVDNCS